MANKYVDVSATYCGDGTTSAQAASDGAVGAWNDLLLAFTGSPGYGTLAAGDNVYVRTNDGSNDLSVTLAANTTMNSTATKDATITWIFDDATIWADSGVFDIEIPLALYLLLGVYNDFKGQDCLRFYETSVTGHHQGWVRFTTQNLYDVIFEATHTGANVINSLYMNAANQMCTMYNPTFICPKGYNSVNYSYCFISVKANTTLNLYNPTFDLTNRNAIAVALFGLYSSAGCLNIHGGKIENSKDTQYLYSLPVISTLNQIQMDGFDTDLMITRNESLWRSGSTMTYIAGIATNIRMFNIPGGKFDFYEDFQYSWSEWRANENYPVLSAVLPDETFWSIKTYPYQAQESWHVPCTKMSKLFTDAADTKTITLEMLINQTFGTIDGDDVYMNVIYVDDDSGEVKFQSTYEVTGAVTSSTAGWDTTGYGSENYDKFKMALTTDFDIKQYTDIYIEVFWKTPPPSLTSFFFICPCFAIA